MRQNSKFIIAAVSATGATQVTASIDTRGYSFARVYCILGLGATTGLSTTLANNTLADSDDGSNFTTITAAGAGTAYTPTTTATGTTIAKIIYEVDLRGRRRYLKPTFTANAGGEHIIMAELSEPSDGATTAAEIGTAFLSQV
jgi:hypothetical protein